MLQKKPEKDKSKWSAPTLLLNLVGTWTVPVWAMLALGSNGLHWSYWHSFLMWNAFASVTGWSVYTIASQAAFGARKGREE